MFISLSSAVFSQNLCHPETRDPNRIESGHGRDVIHKRITENQYNNIILMIPAVEKTMADLAGQPETHSHKIPLRFEVFC